MNFFIEIKKEQLKRFFVDLSRKIGRVKTPMDIVILWLQSNKYLPEKLVAVEPFGMHGLWHTRDYSHLCSFNEIFDIEKEYADFLKKSYKNFSCRQEDSIVAVKNHLLSKEKYNFIVIDNPFGGIYGDNYCEHFDIFVPLLNYLDKESIIIINFIIDQSFFKSEQIKRREEFYGKSIISPKQALEHYIELIDSSSNNKVIDSVFIPRNNTIGYFVFVTKEI